MATPANPAPEKKVVRRQAFNFDTFQKDKLAKSFVPPAPVKSIAEALAEVEQDESKLMDFINKGRESAATDAAWSDPNGWTLAEKNLPSAKPFTGTIVNPGGVLTMARTLAMTIFGMTPEMSKEEKKARRTQAMDFIKSNDAIREALKNAATSQAEDEDGDED